MTPDQPQPISPIDNPAADGPDEGMEPDTVVAEPLRDADGEDAGGDDTPPGETRAVRIPRSPESPSRAEVEEHRARAHLPYRSWCYHCVCGRKHNTPHFRTATASATERTVPQVCLDYAFLRDGNETESCTILVCKDTGTKNLFADVCTRKGALEYSVTRTLGNIRRLGYKRISMKTDQEPALIALTSAVIRERQDETLLEHSAVADSASNGVVEKGVQQIEQQLRVLKFCLQDRIGASIPSTSPIMSWLIPHAADSLNKLEVGADGKTAYERLRGKRYKGEIVEFGSIVRFRLPGILQSGHGKLEPRWAEGLWLGKRWESDEHIIGTSDGIVKCRGIAQVPATERWNRKAVEELKGTPWNWAGDAPDIANEAFIPLDASRVRDPDPPMPAAVPRQLKITIEMLEKFGYSPNCVRCRGLVGHGPTPTSAHEPHCRRRI